MAPVFLHLADHQVASFAVPDEDRAISAAVRAHLARCVDCRARVGAVRALVSEAVTLEDVAGPRADALDRVVRARAAGSRILLPVDDAPVAAPRWQALRPQLWRAARMTAAIAVVVGSAAAVAQGARYLLRRHDAAGSSATRTVPADFRSNSSGLNGKHPLKGDAPGVALDPANGLRASAQVPVPPSHDLGRVVARSSIQFHGQVQAVALGGGRVLVAELLPKTLIVRMFDSSLTAATLITDTLSVSRSPAAGYIIPHGRDSAVMMDNRTLPPTLVFITPEGRLARNTVSPPQLLSAGISRVASSPSLGLFYPFQVNPRAPWDTLGRPTPMPTGAPDWWGEYRFELRRWKYDVHAFDTIGTSASNVWHVGRSGESAPVIVSLFPFYDEAVATVDGAVAIFHAREYRLEWILPDGTRAAPSRSMTYPWRRITDERRQQIVDSLTLANRHVYDSLVAKRIADSIRTGKGPLTPVSRMIEPRQPNVIVMEPAPPTPRPLVVVPQIVPDFYPPTTGVGQVLADADNNVWIRAAALRVDGASVWEVVNRAQGVVDHVRIPDGATIAGFGPGGIVYLVTRDAGLSTLLRVLVR